MNHDQVRVLERYLDGWYHSIDGDGNIIFGSNGHPSSRMEIPPEKMEEFFDRYAQMLVENLQVE